MSKAKRVRTILYGDQKIWPEELDLLNTPALQRLYELHQLGLTDRVFIDASHSRLHHVIGVLEQIEKISNAIIGNLRKEADRPLEFGRDGKLRATEMADEVKRKKPVIRLIGLLHDLTHAPFGHTVEDEINLVVRKHDEPARQADAFYRLVCQYIGWLARDAGVSEEDQQREPTGIPELDGLYIPADLSQFLAQPEQTPPADCRAVGVFAGNLLRVLRTHDNCIFWRLDADEVARLLANLHAAMTALLHLELLHKNKPKSKHIPDPNGYSFQTAIEEALRICDYAGFGPDAKFVPTRDAYMLDIVGNTVCADLLDYAKRDSHFANLKLDYDPDRIAENFTLISWDATAYPGGEERDCRDKTIQGDPFSCSCLRTAISLFSHKLRTDALGELMNLLNVRFYLYERVVFNPTKCAADAMLGTSLQLLGWRPVLQGETNSSELLPERLRHVGDNTFLESTTGAARLIAETLARGVDFAQALRELERLPPIREVDLARNLLGRHTQAIKEGKDPTRSRDEVVAGLRLLDRLKARRYFRPVFRMLPSTAEGAIDVGLRKLAETFRDAQTRYGVEREIESHAKLPTGSVVIHCPERSTARKVANVLVRGPNKDGKEMVRKLCHINEIDEKVFGEHKKATEAVSDMYGSMWRLVVYVAPEYLEKFDLIARSAGAAIVRALPVKAEQKEGVVWRNDPNLQREFSYRVEQRRATRGAPHGEVPATGGQNRAELLERALTDLARETGDPIISDLVEGELDFASVKSALSRAMRLTPPAKRTRAWQVLRSLKPHYGRVPEFHGVASKWIEQHLESVPEEQFSVFALHLSEAARLTPSDLKAARTGRQTQADELVELLNEILLTSGVPARAD